MPTGVLRMGARALGHSKRLKVKNAHLELALGRVHIKPALLEALAHGRGLVALPLFHAAAFSQPRPYPQDQNGKNRGAARGNRHDRQ